MARELNTQCLYDLMETHKKVRVNSKFFLILNLEIIKYDRCSLVQRIYVKISFTCNNRRCKCFIDPMQKWLPLNYSFVRIQNSLTNLVRSNKFFTFFVSKTRLVRLI